MEQYLRIALIKMFTSSKLFVWHLSRRIVKMESAAALFTALSILTILLDKFQTKSFEDMTTLIKKRIVTLTPFEQYLAPLSSHLTKANCHKIWKPIGS